MTRLLWVVLFSVAVVGCDNGSSGPVCEDTCRFAGDGECDDGRAGSITSFCSPGTDCRDCGPNGDPGDPEQDAGGGGDGDCHLEVSCNGDTTCTYFDSCLRDRAQEQSVNLSFAAVIECIQSNSTIRPEVHQTCVCARMGRYDFDDVRNIPDADEWALANCGWIPGVYNGVSEWPTREPDPK